jgi:hypothetical protein
MWCRYREAPSLRRGLRPHHAQRDRAGTWEAQPNPPEWSPTGAVSEGKPKLVTSWLEVGPADSVPLKPWKEMTWWREGAGRRALRWNWRRWPDAALATLAAGRTRFTTLLHHVDVAVLERAFRRQRRAASPGVDRVPVVHIGAKATRTNYRAGSPIFQSVSSPDPRIASESLVYARRLSSTFRISRAL